MKTSCIPTLPDDRFVVIRRSWVAICQDNHCAAALLNFFVSWHDWKIENQPRVKRENDVALNHGVEPSTHNSLIQHHTIAELKDGLCALYSDKTIQKAIGLLVSLGFIKQSRNPDKRYKFDQTKHYLVMPDLVKSALAAFGKNAECNKSNYQIDEAKIPDESVKMPDEKVFLPNHYQDTYQNNYQHSSKTHADPERAREKFDVKNFQPSDPETMPAPLENLTLDRHPALPQSTSGEEKLSAACRTTETNSTTATNSLTRFEQRYSPTLSRQQLAEIAQTIVDNYNKTKPACWGTCTQITAFLTNQVSKLLEIYQKDLPIPEAIASLTNDVAAAHLSCKGDDFYDNPKFGIPSIAFFLDPNRIDKLRNRAQVWYDRPQQQKEQLAHKMVRDAIEGIPSWESGTILTGLRLSLAKTRYRDWYEAGDPQCPSIDYLQQYFPQILGAN